VNYEGKREADVTSSVCASREEGEGLLTQHTQIMTADSHIVFNFETKNTRTSINKKTKPHPS